MAGLTACQAMMMEATGSAYYLQHAVLQRSVLGSVTLAIAISEVDGHSQVRTSNGLGLTMADSLSDSAVDLLPFMDVVLWVQVTSHVTL